MASPTTNANGISTPPPTTAPPSRATQPSTTSDTAAAAPPTTTTTTAVATSGASPSTLQNTPGDPSQSNTAANKAAAPTGQPRLSTQDPGTSKRPRDARLLHLWLGQLGVHAYEERVPLQLMDFAYRYTTGVLADAVALGDSTTAAGAGKGASAAAAGAAGDGTVSLYSVKQAIASRVGFQFNPVLPKDWLKELAEERNKVNLPRVEREFGVRLPPERYCLGGTAWGLKDEWESEEEEDEALESQDVKMGEGAGENSADVDMEDEDDEFEDAMGGDDRMET